MKANSTKLSALCGQVLEMGWLLAVIITPLFFNVYSSRVFEPDKLTALRTLAVVMAAVWLVKYIEERTAGQRGIEIDWHTPLVLPTLFTVVVYLLSTVLSVTPRVSFLGSYQRLQGTYTTLSYIVLFLIILQELRTRVQLDRLITVLIVNGLPVALYGLIQHNKLDPLPWGGDVTKRVASNMGNAIFVAAYLIMTFSLTVGRIAESFKAILSDDEANWADIPRAAGYIFIAAVELIAIWYTQSRGPMVGLMASIGVWAVIVMLALQRIIGRRVWRTLWLGTLVLVVLFTIGFLLINLHGQIHEWALSTPLSRVARILQYQGGTGMVRNLIWEGALDLIKPHAPIQYPPTQDHPSGHPDPFNALRPLVGYGPESMYVAYNGFYPPLLGHHESRTASPDRSHNETMDSLVITGLLGFIAYLWLFGSVFYFALKWMGFIPDDWRRWLFFGLLAGGAIVATAIVVPLIAPHFFCLAIPIGIVIGLVLYLIIYAFTEWNAAPGTFSFHPHFILLASLLTTIVAHFAEINFGIAIASTRTTFWACAGILVVVGLNLIGERETVQETKSGKQGDRKQGNRRNRRRRTASPSPAKSALPTWLGAVLTISLIGGFIMGTLSFDFVTNAERLTKPMSIVWRALTVLSTQHSRTSYGALLIFGLAWLMSAVIFISEMAKSGAFREHKGDGTLAAVMYLLISLAVGLGFALVLAGSQAAMLNVQAQTMADVLGLADHVAGFLTSYYVFIFFTLIAGGLALFLGTRRRTWKATQPGGAIALVVLAVLAVAISITTNLRPIQADIVYKQASPYDSGKQWQVAIEHYKHAIALAMDEDFYYLYLGRAYLEFASTIDDPAVRDNVMKKTEQTLLEAREINPLNTDHSANLARMYRRWVDFTSDADARQSLFQKSAENYEIATSLSPQNAILWNEWASLYLSMGDLAQAQEKCSHSLKIDPDFADTWWKVQASIYASQNDITRTLAAYDTALEIDPRLTDVWLLKGDTYMRQNRLEEAAQSYEQALELNPKRAQVWRVLGSIYAQLGRLDEAVSALQRNLELAPDASDAWDTHRILAIVYSQLGQNDVALSQAQMALEAAPEDQQANIQSMVTQLQAALGEGQP